LIRSRPNSLQYGGTVFDVASSFLRRVVPGVPADDRDGRRLLSPVGLGATALLLARLPTLTVGLSDAPAGVRLREHFDDRTWGVLHSRIAQGVLVLPRERGRYLRGRSRQALRTNIHRAREAGITCRRLERVSQRRAATLQLRERLGGDRVDWPDELFSLPGDAWWAADDPRGRSVALAQVTVDQEWALLRSFVSTHRPSRYLLHAEIVDSLIASGVRYLAVSASMAPLLEPSLQYWQRLLGFRVVNLSLCSKPLAVCRAALAPADYLYLAPELVAQRTPERPLPVGAPLGP
jgi:hypothetical protein